MGAPRRMNMSLRSLLSLAMVAVSGGPAHSAEPLTLTAAVERALANSADVGAAGAEVRAAKARLEGASVLLAANPELSGAVGSRGASGSRTAEWELALSQRVEIGGQRGARVSATHAAL